MSQESAPTIVLDEEFLARYVTVRTWVRLDQTFRPDAFVPKKGTDLSVTRHKDLSNEQIWQIGRDICEKRNPPTTLYGRADLRTKFVREDGLNVESKPLPENLNHAEITGWPIEKSARISLGQLLGIRAMFRQRPGRFLTA